MTTSARLPSSRRLRPGTAGAHIGAALAALLSLAGCAALAPAEAPAPARTETVYAVTADQALIRFKAGAPQTVLARQALSGLASGDALVGIDYRVARGVLYGLTRSGRLVSIDTASGALKPVGDGAPVPAVAALAGQRFGFDFNPAVDRVRVVTAGAHNLRLHPDTGALVSTDPALAYAAGDLNFGRSPDIAGAAYTYNKKDEKITTNFAIDAAAGTLVLQGTREGSMPAVSPNTGQLFTVGALGLGPLLDVAFDIADIDNAALAAVRTRAEPRTRLLLVDLATGRARALGVVGNGQALVGMAIEP